LAYSSKQGIKIKSVLLTMGLSIICFILGYQLFVKTQADKYSPSTPVVSSMNNKINSSSKS
jgi:hypothetical protein